MAPRCWTSRAIAIFVLLSALVAPLTPMTGSATIADPAAFQQRDRDRDPEERDRNRNRNRDTNRAADQDEADASPSAADQVETLSQEEPTAAAAGPEGLPAEIGLDAARFLFDRIVDVDPNNLAAVGTQGDLALLALAGADAPFDRLYVASPQGDGFGRYLAEIPVANGVADPENPCLAQTQDLGQLPTEDGLYAFGGFEPDRSTDDLEPFATTQNGATVYAEPDEAPSPELFVETGDGLLRFLLLNEQGLPVVFEDGLRFGGQDFAYDGDVSNSVDVGALDPVGCAGPYATLADQGGSVGELDRLYLLTAGAIFEFIAAPDRQAPGTEPEEGAIEPTEESASVDESTPASEETPAGTPAPDATDDAAADEVAPSAEAPATPAPDDAVEIEASVTPPGAETETVEDAAGSADLVEIEVSGARYLRDRVVPIDPDRLTSIETIAGGTVFARGDSGPFDPVYLISDSGDQPVRYWSEQATAADDLCNADRGNFAILPFGDLAYAYAGPESDILVDALEPVLETGGGETIYAESQDQPYPELFYDASGVLNRFVLLDESGVPTNLDEAIPFGGQVLRFDGDVTGEIDPASLQAVGCVGPFPVVAEPDEEAGNLSQAFVLLADQQTPRVLAFQTEGAAAAPATPTVEAATPSPTETPRPTATPEPTATIAPTSTPTPEPTATATVVPTEEPTITPEPTATAVPTETALPPTTEPSATTVPTEIPPSPTVEPTATAVPTETPSLPTAEPAPSETPPATEAPTQPPAATEPPAPTSPPTETEAPDVAPTPLVLPTVAPAPTPLSAIPVDAPAPIPADFPKEIEVQGIRYSFDLEVDLDPASLIPVDVVTAPGLTLEIFVAREDEPASARRGYRQTVPVGPFLRVYAVSVSGIVARYLPQAPITPTGTIDFDTPCLAETTSGTFSYTFEQSEYRYVAASVETNLAVNTLRAATIDALGEVPTIDDGRELFVSAVAGIDPLAEVFVPTDTGLQRFVALNEAGFPVSLNGLVFAETQFRYESEVSLDVTASGFGRVGCAGPFPLYAPPAQARGDAPLGTVVTIIDNRVYQFASIAIVVAPRGQVAPPVSVAPPPAGIVQVVLVAPQARSAPTPTPLPNIRLLTPPRAGASPTPTPTRNLVINLPVQPNDCQGDPGEIGRNGLPDRLPRRIQLSGVAYRYTAEASASPDAELTRVACIGPFEALQASDVDPRQALFLRDESAPDALYRFEAATSFDVGYQAGDDLRVIRTGDTRYVLDAAWPRSIYSSVTLIVHAQDAESLDPPRIFAVPVDGDVIAEYVPEGGDVVEAPEALSTEAEGLGINPDLVLANGQRYLLVNLWRPVGTTTNGWLTLYSAIAEGVPDLLLGSDPRSLDLFLYRQ